MAVRWRRYWIKLEIIFKDRWQISNFRLVIAKRRVISGLVCDEILALYVNVYCIYTLLGQSKTCTLVTVTLSFTCGPIKFTSAISKLQVASLICIIELGILRSRKHNIIRWLIKQVSELLFAYHTTLSIFKSWFSHCAAPKAVAQTYGSILARASDLNSPQGMREFKPGHMLIILFSFSGIIHKELLRVSIIFSNCMRQLVKWVIGAHLLAPEVKLFSNVSVEQQVFSFVVSNSRRKGYLHIRVLL